MGANDKNDQMKIYSFDYPSGTGGCEFFSTYLWYNCIRHVSAVLPEVQQWPSRGRCHCHSLTIFTQKNYSGVKGLKRKGRQQTPSVSSRVISSWQKT